MKNGEIRILILEDVAVDVVHICGHKDILQTETAAKLDKNDRKHLETMAERAKPMSILIDVLLDSSRMGRSEMRHMKVDMRHLVEEVRYELQPETEGREIAWQLGDLPVVRGDLVMLRHALTNLISNALKYSRTRKPAIIEIGAKTQGEETVCFVRDNGVGFDMKYAGMLFGVFQRLHPPREFGGTGISLANVRRIIQRHGGRVWAEAKPDEGATFFFSLPHQMNGS